jgi:hypothetical protein
VDEETAFSWPACGICENDLLVELGPNHYLCQNCDSFSQTSTKMSLEVFISCPQIPDSCKVKVKVRSYLQLKKFFCHQVSSCSVDGWQVDQFRSRGQVAAESLDVMHHCTWCLQVDD